MQTANEYSRLHLLPVIHMLAGHRRHDLPVAQQRQLIELVVKYLNLICEIPHKEWIDYWMKAQPDFKRNRNIPDLSACTENALKELKRRSSILQKYRSGLWHLKQILIDECIWKVLDRQYVESQHYLDNKCRTEDEMKELNELLRQRNTLYEQEKELKASLTTEDDDDEAESQSLHRLKRSSIHMEKQKKRTLQNLQREIFVLTERISELNAKESQLRDKEEEMLMLIRDVILKALSLPSLHPTKSLDAVGIKQPHLLLLRVVFSQAHLMDTIREWIQQTFHFLQKEVNLSAEWTAGIIRFHTQEEMKQHPVQEGLQGSLQQQKESLYLTTKRMARLNPFRAREKIAIEK
ncbi:hypothetical protein IE077_002775, partial [Cardiosporidium cionae]